MGTDGKLPVYSSLILCMYFLEVNIEEHSIDTKLEFKTESLNFILNSECGHFYRLNAPSIDKNITAVP